MTATPIRRAPRAPCDHAVMLPGSWVRILTLIDPAQPPPDTVGGHTFAVRRYRLDDRPGPRASRVTGLHLDDLGVLTATIRAMAEDVDVLTHPCGLHHRVFVADIDVLCPGDPDPTDPYRRVPRVRWIGPPERPHALVKAAAVAAEVDLYVGELHTATT